MPAGLASTEASICVLRSAREDCPALMISPTAPDLQIALGVSFFGEAARTNQCNGREVPRLDVCFEAMQLQFGEGLSDQEPQSFLHQSLALTACEGVETEVCTPEQSSDDIRDFDESDELT